MCGRTDRNDEIYNLDLGEVNHTGTSLEVLFEPKFYSHTYDEWMGFRDL